MNKYERTPEYILDLHGNTLREAEGALNRLLKERRYSHIRIITGKSSFRETGPVLKPFVKQYLVSKGCKVEPAKLKNGGDGAWEVYF